ncbi:MAG TPA: OmpH family outer membrane protein [Sphingobacterium sp.]|nr:OmpH family outer membrane protein [Sphingobacterium sp.]
MKNLVKGAVLAVGLLATSSVAVQAQQKIGHLNAEEIFQLTPEFKTAQEQLKTLNDTKQKELEGMYQELQKKQEEADLLMKNQSAANKDETEKKLQVLGQEYQQMEGRVREVQRIAQEDLNKKQQELLAPIQTKVMGAINSVAQEKGYAYILDLAAGSVIYFQGGEDVTAEVKAKLGIQ